MPAEIPPKRKKYPTKQRQLFEFLTWHELSFQRLKMKSSDEIQKNFSILIHD